MNKILKEYKCVDKWQAEADYYHADWRMIESESRNKAKSKYSKLTGSKYIDVICYVNKK